MFSLPPPDDLPFDETGYAQSAQPVDPLDPYLEIAGRFTSLFAAGVAITLICRWLTVLLPLYWIAMLGSIAFLAWQVYSTRSLRLLGLAIALAMVLIAGHWDALSHAFEQWR